MENVACYFLFLKITCLILIVIAINAESMVLIMYWTNPIGLLNSVQYSINNQSNTFKTTNNHQARSQLTVFSLITLIDLLINLMASFGILKEISTIVNLHVIYCFVCMLIGCLVNESDLIVYVFTFVINGLFAHRLYIFRTDEQSSKSDELGVFV